MMLLLDTGALIAYERGSRTVQAFLERAHRTGDTVRTSTAAVAQAWRDGSRQARVALLLRGTDESELTRDRARRIGRLLLLAGTADVVDGSIVDLGHDGDEILTSDTDDMQRLATVAGKTLIVTHVS
ncbi:MAG: PIN domain-containing protein [Acidimicrobiales bacterium]